MTLEVLYFANLRELLGKERESVELPASSATLNDLLALLAREHRELENHLTSIRFAVNEEFRDVTATLASGDVIALIPPVSGG